MDINSEKIRIQEHVEKGNYHAAINIALSCLNEKRRNNDQSGVDEFLVIIRGIVRKLEKEFASEAYHQQ